MAHQQSDDQRGPASATPPSHSGGPPDSATRQKAMESVAELWERFKGTIMGRVAVLEQSTMALLEGALDDDLRQNARGEAHKLAGSVGLFGFSRGSELAQEIELTLLEEANLDQGRVLRLSQMVVALRQELEKGAPSPITAADGNAASDDQAHGDSAHMLVIDHDVELAEGLVTEGVARGMQAEMASDLAGARDAISRRRPGVVLLDLSLADDLGDSLSLLSELSDGPRPVPVFALTDRDAFGDRLQVARLGGQGFLSRSLPPARLMDSVSQLLVQTRPSTHKVMAVGTTTPSRWTR